MTYYDPLPVPLSDASPVFVQDLALDFFFDRHMHNKPCSFWKLNHGHWEWLWIYYSHIMGIDPSDAVSPISTDHILSDEFQEGFARWMIEDKEPPRFYGGPPRAEPEALASVFKLIRDRLRAMSHPSGSKCGYFIGVSDSTWQHHKSINGHAVGAWAAGLHVPRRRIHEIIRAFLPPDHSSDSVVFPLRGTLFKSAFRTNGQNLHQFLTMTCTSHHALYVGNLLGGLSQTFANLGMSYLETPRHNNLSTFEDTLARVREWISSKPTHETKTVFFCGGHTQVMWIDMLHGQYENTFLLDTGKSLDPLLNAQHKPSAWETRTW